MARGFWELTGVSERAVRLSLCAVAVFIWDFPSPFCLFAGLCSLVYVAVPPPPILSGNFGLRFALARVFRFSVAVQYFDTVLAISRSGVLFSIWFLSGALVQQGVNRFVWKWEVDPWDLFHAGGGWQSFGG